VTMTQPLFLANYLLEQEVLGQGLATPLVSDPLTGDFQTINGEDNVTQCILDLLLTRPGERLMFEDFGTSIPSSLFANKPALMQVLPIQVTQAINQFESRVTNVSATAIDAGPTAVQITVTWIVKATGTPGSLVYPIYLQPAAGGVSGSQ
jgi:phage baseplate assembly protein W